MRKAGVAIAVVLGIVLAAALAVPQTASAGIVDYVIGDTGVVITLVTPDSRQLCSSGIDIFGAKVVPRTIPVRLLGFVNVQYVLADGSLQTIPGGYYAIDQSRNFTLQITYPPLDQWPVQSGGMAEIHVDVEVDVYVNGVYEATIGTAQSWTVHCQVQPTPTPTNTPVTPVVPSATPTNTSVPPSATPTNTPVTPVVPSATPTNTPVTPVVPSATPTNTPETPTAPSATPTNTPVTPVVPSATPTNTPETPTAPSATPSNTPVTPVVPSATPTNTPETPTAPSATPSNTPVTPVVPSATPTNTPETPAPPTGEPPTSTPETPGVPSATPTNPPETPAPPTGEPPTAVPPTDVPPSGPPVDTPPANVCAEGTPATVTMSVTPQQVLPGQVVEFVVTVHNPHGVTLSGVKVTNSLSVFVEYLNAVATFGQPMYDAAARTVTLEIGDMAIGQSVVLNISGRVATGAQAPNGVSNSAQICQPGGCCATATSTAQIMPGGIPVTGAGPSLRDIVQMVVALASGTATALSGGWLVFRDERRSR
ncbi:MAG: hypothetical protein IT318_17590 [Anaerolineales bacterium]|nr:hypothetical protein [Anaerolineales bacterium]